MTILIVDDEPEALEEIYRSIERYPGDHRCVMCGNAPEALAQSEKTRFDIALLDIEMPIMNGLELSEQLITLYPHIKFIFITAYNHYATEAFEVNAVDYILKPMREERLFKALDRLNPEHNNTEQKHIAEALSVQMFGKFVVRIGDTPYTWNRMKSAELFAYLLENKGQPVHKEKLCDVLWQALEPRKALTNLQTVIYTIRRLLESIENSPISVRYADNCYMFQVKSAVTDADCFENLLVEARRKKDISLLKKAMRLYTADYLEEDGWLWAEPRKAFLRRKYVAALKQLNNR